MRRTMDRLVRTIAKLSKVETQTTKSKVVANVPVDGVSLEQELPDNLLAYEYSRGKKLSRFK